MADSLWPTPSVIVGRIKFDISGLIQNAMGRAYDSMGVLFVRKSP